MTRFGDYEGSPTVLYGNEALFIRVCPKCGRFVKGDAKIQLTAEGPPVQQPNASCRKCGRVQMPFEGYYEGE